MAIARHDRHSGSAVVYLTSRSAKPLLAEATDGWANRRSIKKSSHSDMSATRTFSRYSLPPDVAWHSMISGAFCTKVSKSQRYSGE